MSNKSIIAILAGIIFFITGALVAAFFIKKKLDSQYDDESFEDFDMIGDDEDFFAEEDYDAVNPSSDSIPYTNHIRSEQEQEDE